MSLDTRQPCFHVFPASQTDFNKGKQVPSWAVCPLSMSNNLGISSSSLSSLSSSSSPSSSHHHHHHNNNNLSTVLSAHHRNHPFWWCRLMCHEGMDWKPIPSSSYRKIPKKIGDVHLLIFTPCLVLTNICPHVLPKKTTNNKSLSHRRPYGLRRRP